MGEKILNKQDILKEIENILNLYDDDIAGIGYSIHINFKDFENIEIKKNHYSGFVTPNYCNCTV